jgi:hypothetical protein
VTVLLTNAVVEARVNMKIIFSNSCIVYIHSIILILLFTSKSYSQSTQDSLITESYTSPSYILQLGGGLLTHAVTFYSFSGNAYLNTREGKYIHSIILSYATSTFATCKIGEITSSQKGNYLIGILGAFLPYVYTAGAITDWLYDKGSPHVLKYLGIGLPAVIFSMALYDLTLEPSTDTIPKDHKKLLKGEFFPIVAPDFLGISCSYQF